MCKKDKEIVISRKHLTVIGVIVIVLVFFVGYGFAYLNWGIALANRLPFKYFAGNSQFGKFLQVNSLIQEEYIGEAEQDQLTEQAIGGLVYGLNDPYSFYLTPEQAEQERIDNSGVTVGIGVSVYFNEKHELIISEVYENCPAEKAGIQANDILTAIDGVPIASDATVNQVAERIKGEEGTEVSVTVMREGAVKTVSVTRARFEQVVVKYEKIDDYGYISIDGFTGEAVKQFNAAIARAEKEQAKGLVIDVRNNPGGDLGIYTKITDRIVGTGKLIYLQNREGEKRYTTATTEEAYTKPIAVLVNGKSASAAEAFSGTLQDYGCAVLVGSKTFGKGIAQTIYTLSDGSAVHLTTEYYYLPEGRCIHGEGIQPDYTVELPEELVKNPNQLTHENDTQLQKALAVLREMAP